MLGAGHAGWLLFVNAFSTLGKKWVPSSIKPYSPSNSRNLLYWWLTVQEQLVNSALSTRKVHCIWVSVLWLSSSNYYIDIYKDFSKVSNLESLLFYLGMQGNICQFLKVYRFSLFIPNDQILNSYSLNFLSSETTFFSYLLLFTAMNN